MKIKLDKNRLLDQAKYLLFYRIDQGSGGTRTVFFYKPSQAKEIDPQPNAQDAADLWRTAAADTGGWEANFSTTERIVAELFLQGHTAPFLIRYYSVGPDDNSRIASFFVQELKSGDPILSGALDYPNPATKERLETFFRRVNKDGNRWSDWANQAFVVEHQVTPVLRIKEEKVDYVGLYTDASLYAYPEGWAKGGLPFGSEETFLAMSNISSKEWRSALDLYKGSFIFWNLICRHDSLERVFIQGEPGAGKELWYEAIQGGVRARLKGEWKSVAATLPVSQLDDLLYGEQSGTLERVGYLKKCEGGGIFLDEIGKSEDVFRKNLLRVLESKEFLPKGGQPVNFKRLLFVFASTNQDREKASNPPDFWTRMDVELALPEPIIIRKRQRWGTALAHLTEIDEARFYSLLAQFWFSTIGFSPVDPKDAAFFKNRVFDPILEGIRSERIQDNLPISPRRIRSFARTLAGEFRWIGSSRDHLGEEADRASTALDSLRRDLIRKFVAELHYDAKNREKLEKTTNS
jgi:hypothetical protein